MSDPYCLCCCRPLSEHINKRQCPETTYFIANEPGQSTRAAVLEEAANKCIEQAEVIGAQTGSTIWNALYLASSAIRALTPSDRGDAS